MTIKQKPKTSATENMTFVYDAAGKLVEEYSGSTLQTAYVYAGSRLLTTETAIGTNYLTSDHLGSPRINTDGSGNVTARHDYMPFGEEVFTVGGRTVGLGYASDNVRKKFTGYERDNETELDFAQARYFDSGYGRFSSPDDFLNDSHASSPSSWNLYIYARNNPLTDIDPLGQTVENSLDKNKRLSDKQLELIAADLRKKSGLSSITFNNGVLTYDHNEKASGGSEKLRRAITGAIDDQKNVFRLNDVTGSTSINFQNTDSGTTFQNGQGGITRTEYEISIDFGDYQNAALYSDNSALEAFSVGDGLFHEIDHKVSYDPADPIMPGLQRPDTALDPLGPAFMNVLDRPGVIQNERMVQSQLGLPLRDNDHVAHPGPNGTFQISFHDKNGNQKFVRWKLEGSR